MSAAGYALHYSQFRGLDGAAVPIWGEDYKPFDWLGGTGPENWDFGTDEYPENWSPGGHHTLKYPYWLTDPEHGLPMGEFVEVNGQWQYVADPSLEDYVFTANLFMETSDAWWGGNAQGQGERDAPNSLDDAVLAVWFADYMGSTDDPWTHLSDGNTVIPEPSSIVLLTFDLGFLGTVRGGRRLRRKTA